MFYDFFNANPLPSQTLSSQKTFPSVKRKYDDQPNSVNRRSFTSDSEIDKKNQYTSIDVTQSGRGFDFLSLLNSKNPQKALAGDDNDDILKFTKSHQSPAEPPVYCVPVPPTSLTPSPTSSAHLLSTYGPSPDPPITQQISSASLAPIPTELKPLPLLLLPPPPPPRFPPPLPPISQSWAEKYRPTSGSQVFGNTKNVSAFKKWVQKIHKDRRSSSKFVVLLHGPPGIGKTSMAHAILKEIGYQICEINASLDRTKTSIVQTLNDVATRTPLVGRTAIILDEIDGGMDNSDGAADGVLSFLKEMDQTKTAIQSPIVCIANDVFGKSMQRLVHSVYVYTLRFYPPFPSDLSKVLARIIQKEHIQITEKDKVVLIQQCGGDVRRLVTMCESYKLGPTKNQPGGISSFIQMSSKDTFMNNFNITKHVLVNDKMKCETAVELIQSDQSLITNMLQENHINLFISQYDQLRQRGPPPTESIDILLRMSELCDDLSSVDIFNQSTEIYQDEKNDARYISASWLNASVGWNRTAKVFTGNTTTSGNTTISGNITTSGNITSSGNTTSGNTTSGSTTSGNTKTMRVFSGARLPHIDNFQVQPASCYARQKQLLSYSSQLRHFETSCVLGEDCGYQTLTVLNMLISLFIACDFHVLKELLPNLGESNWNALREARLSKLN